MVKEKKKDYKKTIKTQNLIIIMLAILIVIMVFVSTTAAWYIRSRTDTADITLAHAVNVYTTEFENVLDDNGYPITDSNGNPIGTHTRKDLLEGRNTKIYPGDKINLKLGMVMGDADNPSSRAYLRAKLIITYERIIDGVIVGAKELADDNLIKYIDAPSSGIWEKVDFNEFAYAPEDPDRTTDYWWVYKTTTADGVAKAGEALDGEEFVFVDGFIELNRMNVTNAQANCKFHIEYKVEAIQVPNVPDPIVYKGYGPWWGYAKGDIEDVNNAG